MIPARDRKILRDLARRVAEIAELPIMAERKKEWKRHNSLQPGRPLILIFPEGSWSELLPASALQCEDPAAREMEWELRHRIYTYEHFQSDNVVEGEWIVPKSSTAPAGGCKPGTTTARRRAALWPSTR